MNETNNNPNPLGVKRWAKIGDAWIGDTMLGHARGPNIRPGTPSGLAGGHRTVCSVFECAILKRDGVDIPQADEYEITTDASGRHGILHKRTNGFAPFLNRLGATTNLQRILSGATRFSVYSWVEYQPKPEPVVTVTFTAKEAREAAYDLENNAVCLENTGSPANAGTARKLKGKIEQAITAVGGR